MKTITHKEAHEIAQAFRATNSPILAGELLAYIAANEARDAALPAAIAALETCEAAMRKVQDEHPDYTIPDAIQELLDIMEAQLAAALAAMKGEK